MITEVIKFEVAGKLFGTREEAEKFEAELLNPDIRARIHECQTAYEITQFLYTLRTPEQMLLAMDTYDDRPGKKGNATAKENFQFGISYFGPGGDEEKRVVGLFRDAVALHEARS